MQTINADKLKEMINYGTAVLNQEKEKINALNVFPVPDGDTGSNMSMTITAGNQEIAFSEFLSVGELAKAFSRGLLMGARGNSGVILSQFFRGFAQGLDGKEEITPKDFQAALVIASERAYSSVIKAVEGTILTVTKDMAYNIKEVPNEFVAYFAYLESEAEKSLENTPNLLPVLKEVGVVDSGGYGLVTIIKAFGAIVRGEKLTIAEDESFENFRRIEEHPTDPADIVFGYCTEMLIRLDEPEEFNLATTREKLETMGDSIVAVQDGDILKVHVHTEQPTKAFEYARQFGDYIHLKSENMRIQAENEQKKQGQIIEEEKERIEQAIVTVASSEEMGNLFNKITEVTVISGGQTLNPSTNEIVEAIKKTNAKSVIVLPNNSNIILAAQSAKELIEDVEIKIIETKYMTQAVEILPFFDIGRPIAENVEEMNSILKELVNVEVTLAVRDTSIDGIEIKEGQFLQIIDGKIKGAFDTVENLLSDLIEMFAKFEPEAIVLLAGKDAKTEEIDYLKKIIEDKLEFTDLNIYETNQPVYSYLLSGIR